MQRGVEFQNMMAKVDVLKLKIKRPVVFFQSI